MNQITLITKKGVWNIWQTENGMTSPAMIDLTLYARESPSIKNSWFIDDILQIKRLFIIKQKNVYPDDIIIILLINKSNSLTKLNNLI